jgi:signal transduction histidine kinase
VERFGLHSALFVPLCARGRVIGVLNVRRETPGRPYTADDQAFLQELADRVALAVDNMRLYQQLAERERRLHDLLGKLLVAQEEERRRVAYDVHDGLAQVAASAHQHLQAFARRHSPRDPAARRELDRALELARLAVSEARAVVANLRPTALDDFGLAPALRLQVQRLQAEGWQVAYQEELDGERLPAPIETALFRVAQEALTNVQKHARTDRVEVALARRGRLIRLEVRDWGHGFEAEAGGRDAGAGERVGLAGMRERIAQLGGRWSLESRPGEGTRVVAEVPLELREAVGRSDE